MAVRVGLDHHHHVGVVGEAFEQVIIGAQRGEIDFSNGPSTDFVRGIRRTAASRERVRSDNHRPPKQSIKSPFLTLLAAL